MNSNAKRIFKNIVSSILVVLIFFCGFITLVNITFKSIYLKTQVTGVSMQPTININMKDSQVKGDTIYVNQYTTFTNNDIVVAKVDWHENYIIKRVVGTPGDKIEIKDETTQYGVYVNDKLLYTKKKYGDQLSFPRTGSYGYYDCYLSFLSNLEFEEWVVRENGEKYIQLGENEYFLMGDNWGQTTDSIFKGPVKTNEIIGKVELIVDVNNKNPLIPTWFFLKKLFS